MNNCACGSYLRRNGEATGDSDGTASVMDASFVHLPPSLLVQSGHSERGAIYKALQHRVHPLHLEYLESIVNNETGSSSSLTSPPELCLYCVQR